MRAAAMIQFTTQTATGPLLLTLYPDARHLTVSRTCAHPNGATHPDCLRVVALTERQGTSPEQPQWRVTDGEGEWLVSFVAGLGGTPEVSPRREYDQGWGAPLPVVAVGTAVA